MINKSLDSFLRKETDSEKWHKKNMGIPSEAYKKLTTVERNNQKIYLFDFTEDMASDDIIIFKETRYAELYAHYHKYMELNYVYSGSCEFEINSVQGVLQAGDICIMEPDVVHSAKVKGKNDIVINIALKNKYFQSNFLNQIDKQGIIANFLTDCLNETRSRDHFLVFRYNNNVLLDLTVNSILYLYFFNKGVGYYSKMEEYVKLMYMHLANSVYDSTWSYYQNKSKDSIMIDIIQFISRNYSVCSLKDVAKEFNYNYNYLGNMIKKRTGHTFNELKLDQQLIAAKELLLYSNLPVSEICYKCGFTNQSFFYKKFSSSYNYSPSQYRKTHSQKNLNL